MYEIFEEEAKINQEFAKKFYLSRGKEFIPYAENKALQEQIRAIATITANEYMNISRTTVMAGIDNMGNVVYKNIQQTYQDIIDKAVLSLTQGKETYQQVISRSMKTLAGEGIQTVEYETGARRRLDSAIRMNVLDSMRNMSNTLQNQFGEEFDADGIEVSHHLYSAPDHIDTVDGKQFSKNGRVKVKGKWYEDFNTVNNSLARKVSTLNCYHYIFNIVLGVSKPEFTDEQLEADKKKNNEGFEFEGRHFTMYERNTAI